VALVIDIYDSTNNRAVTFRNGEFIERGEDFKKMYDIFIVNLRGDKNPE
jgi:hypothetical protein